MNNHIKKVTFGILMICIVLLCSCSRSINFNKSAVVPAASGKVRIKEDKNDNYSIHIKISNLAPPERLQPPMEYYVVWMETDGNPVQNLGRLISSSPLFVKSLKASLKTVTTYRPSRFFITAEDKTDIQFPRGQQIISTDTYNYQGK